MDTATILARTKRYELQIDGQLPLVIEAVPHESAQVISGLDGDDREGEGSCTVAQADILESMLMALAIDDVDIAAPVIVHAINVALEIQANFT